MILVKGSKIFNCFLLCRSPQVDSLQNWCFRRLGKCPSLFRKQPWGLRGVAGFSDILAPVVVGKFWGFWCVSGFIFSRRSQVLILRNIFLVGTLSQVDCLQLWQLRREVDVGTVKHPGRREAGNGGVGCNLPLGLRSSSAGKARADLSFLSIRLREGHVWHVGQQAGIVHLQGGKCRAQLKLRRSSKSAVLTRILIMVLVSCQVVLWLLIGSHEV